MTMPWFRSYQAAHTLPAPSRASVRLITLPLGRAPPSAASPTLTAPWKMKPAMPQQSPVTSDEPSGSSRAPRP